MARLHFEFHGTVSTCMNLDTQEFRGMTRQQAEDEIRMLLRALHPGMEPDELDVLAAVGTLTGTSG